MNTEKYIPELMRSLPNWVLWKIENDAKGRPTKIPYSANYDGKASSTNPETWTSYQKALQVYEANKSKYNGIGFVLSEQVGLAFIDIDHCFDQDGELSFQAQEIVDKLPNTYWEVSQSGNGLHCIVKGSIEYGFNNRELGVEMYSSKRFIAFTGNAIVPQEPQSYPDQVRELFDKYKTKRKEKDSLAAVPHKIDYSEQEIIEKACNNKRNGLLFQELYKGNWEAYYSSQSEADQGFCNMLAFFCNRDFQMIDSIFKSSGLYRDKWDRYDYKTKTINNAINDCSMDLYEYKQLKEQEKKKQTTEIGFTLNDKGKILKNLENCVIALKHDELLSGMFQYDKMQETICVRKKTPWPRLHENVLALDETDLCHLDYHLDINYGLNNEQLNFKAVKIVASESQYHPIVDMLESLPHDGNDYLSELFPRYLGAERNEYTTFFTTKLFMHLIDRVYRPGSKHDEMFILIDNEQGKGKSTMCQFLALNDTYYTDNASLLSDNDTFYRAIRGKWVVELSEMKDFKNSKYVDEVKARLSSRLDDYCEKYGKLSSQRPRQCVFIGTTNRIDAIPNDATGNRRFIPLKVGAISSAIHPLENEAETRLYIQKCYAQALDIYKNGQYQFKLTDSQLQEINAQLDKFTCEDALETAVLEYLETCNKDTVCAYGILDDMKAQWSPNLSIFSPKPAEDSRLIYAVMDNTATNWQRYVSSNGKVSKRRMGKYGTVTAWVRKS